jgi:predicted cupin superfamily sugar epimerase
MWFFHAGCPLEIVLITPEGLLERRFLGHPAYHAECSFQVLLPAGTIFAARIYDDSSYFDSDFALVSCTVAPGFEFADFELLSRAALLADFPEFSEEIRQFTKA